MTRRIHRQSKKNRIKGIFTGLNARRKAYLSVRPHRSFRLSKRRDYVRAYKLSSPLVLLAKTFDILFKNKKLFIGLAGIYAVITFLLVGIASSETYNFARDLVLSSDYSIEDGEFSVVGGAFVTIGGILLSGPNQATTEGGQIISGVMAIVLWMSVIWSMRSIMRGTNQEVRIRDALYNSGAPIVATLCLALILLVQMIPLAIAVSSGFAVNQIGFANANIGIMLLTFGAFLLGVLGIYWIMPTIFGMIIVTVQGSYPLEAWRYGSEVVIGRRVSLILRLIAVLVFLAVMWFVIFVPLTLLDNWLLSMFNWLEKLSIVPYLMIFYTSLALVFFTIYIYILYRETVEMNAKEERKK